MPTYTDPSTGKRYTSADPLSPDELAMVFGGGGNPTPPPDSQPQGFFEATGKMARGRLGEITQPLQHAASTPYDTSKNPMAAMAPAAGDVAALGANIAGTVMGPYSTALGVGGELAGRMHGGEQGGQIGRFAGEMTGPSAALGKVLFSGSKRGLIAAGEAIGRRLGSASVTEGGDALRAGLNTTLAARKAPLKPIFERVGQFAKSNGVAIDPSDPLYQEAVQLAKETKQMLPNLSGPGRRVVQDILRAAKGKPAKGLNPAFAGHPAMQATVTPTPISWDNLEKFHKMLSQITQKGDYLSATNQGVTPNTIRRMAYRLRNIQEGSLQGFPDVQQQFGDVRKAWKAEVGPVQRMAGVAGKVTAANPLESSTGKQVLQRFGGFDLEDTTRISKALQEIGPNTPQANLVRASMWSKFLGGKSPEQIGKAWEELGQTNPEAIKLLRGANGAQVDRNLQKIAKIAKYVGSDTRGMIRRNALAVITAGTTGLVFGMQRGTASLWDGTLPLGMLMAYGTGRGIQTFVRALHTPRGTQEAARLGVLVAREAERIYDRANEGVQAYEEE